MNLENVSSCFLKDLGYSFLNYKRYGSVATFEVNGTSLWVFDNYGTIGPCIIVRSKIIELNDPEFFDSLSIILKLF